jgi:hypothetical protein
MSARAALLAIVLAVGGCASALSAEVEPGLSRTRAYDARIVSGTRQYRGARGTLEITIELMRVGPESTPGSESRVQYSARVVLRGKRCPPRPPRGCRVLWGTLTGTGVWHQPRVSDDPSSVAVSAAGKVARVGIAQARGELEGTGFVPNGHRTVVLRLTTSEGAIVISGRGPSVSGFTSP